MVTTVTNNSTQQINTSLFSLQKEIDALSKLVKDQAEQIEKLTKRVKELETH